MINQYRVELRNYEGIVSSQTFGNQDTALTFALMFATEGISAKLSTEEVAPDSQPDWSQTPYETILWGN